MRLKTFIDVNEYCLFKITNKLFKKNFFTILDNKTPSNGHKIKQKVICDKITCVNTYMTSL